MKFSPEIMNPASNLQPASVFLIAALLVIATVSPVWSADYVWREGEAAQEHGFTNQGFPPSHYGDKAQGLAAGDAVS